MRREARAALEPEVVKVGSGTAPSLRPQWKIVRGFDPQQEHEGFGLIVLKERVDGMDGEFIVRVKRGVGTEILIELKNQPASKRETGNEQI